jgi:hypothetical protein
MSLDLLVLPAAELVALVVATSFAAGLNVSATVATIGLLARAGLIVLPPALDPIGSWWVIGVALAVFLIEFVADKTPVLDLIWNALQTFIRVPAGALLAYGATTQLSPAQQLLAAALGAGIALAAHAGKAALHASVTASPDPFSTIAVSLAEDAFAIFLTWFATRHPFLAAAIALTFIVAIAVLIRVVWRAFRRKPTSGVG